MKPSSFYCFLISLFIVATSCGPEKPSSSNPGVHWQMVYKHGPDGQSVYGSKAALMSAIRNGYPVRIGWASRSKTDTTRSVEHVLDANFLTIANQSEVFAQVEPFYAQRPDLDSDTLRMTPLTKQMGWLLGTNGTISSVDRDFGKDTAQAYPSNAFGYGLSWYVQAPKGTTFKNPPVSLWD